MEKGIRNKMHIFVALVLSLVSGPSYSDTVIDQEQIGRSGGTNNVHYYARYGQTVTVGISGILTGVEFWMESYGANADVTLSIQGLDSNDSPDDSNILGSATLGSAQIGNPSAPRLFDFSASQINVTQGDKIALVLSSTDDPWTTGDVVVLEYGEHGNPYEGGSDFRTQGCQQGETWCELYDTDMVFRTYVSTEPAGFSADKIVWSDAASTKIQSSDPDGSNLQDIAAGLGEPYGSAVHSSSGKVYWSDVGVKIQRSNIDGTNVEDLPIPGFHLTCNRSIAIDSDAEKIYWPNFCSDKIQRANLDGTNIEDVLTGLESPQGIALDLAGGKIYWTDPAQLEGGGISKIRRANLDGTNQETLISNGLQAPRQIQVDSAAGKIYWTDQITKKIQRANLDGTNVEDILTNLQDVIGIALDLVESKLYWSQAFGASQLFRSDLDGTNIEALLSGLSIPWQIAIYSNVVSDQDGDGVEDVGDNCLAVANPNQTDTDSDGVGDACDSDDDADGVDDNMDNCPTSFGVGSDQTDSDGDGAGDVCDSDVDGDGFDNNLDNCAAIANPFQTDTDSDGLGDACDTDDDDDGIPDIADGSGNGPDNCPETPNPLQEDLDSDGIGDSCDADLDGDGVENSGDNCPITVGGNGDQTDTDLDMQGDVCDADDDDDLIIDGSDNCPLTYNPEQEDTDGDGTGDFCNSGIDMDGDNWADNLDNCPTIANGNQADLDNDGMGDICDSDVDNDGVNNEIDICPATDTNQIVNPGNGCSIEQTCPCEGPRGTNLSWKNHGKYVSCIAHTAKQFEKIGLISNSAKGDIVSDAAQSECGK